MSVLVVAIVQGVIYSSCFSSKPVPRSIHKKELVLEVYYGNTFHPTLVRHCLVKVEMTKLQISLLLQLVFLCERGGHLKTSQLWKVSCYERVTVLELAWSAGF